MVLTKEYRICMPITVEEYKIGQLYMIARHSLEQSGNGEGVEVVENKECFDDKHGQGQYTEKRIYLSTRLPYWIQAICPNIFYITEKAWNYYPLTITEYTCSFIPKFNISIETKYLNDNGSTENCLDLSADQLAERVVDFIDIAYDEVQAKHYKEEEDPRFFKSKVTNRGPLVDGWRSNYQPIMCSYKVVHASFEVFGLQTRVENFVHSCIRDILLLGHRQAFAWIDEWYEMSIDDVRKYESQLQQRTNKLVTDVESKQTETIDGPSGDSSSVHSLTNTSEPSTPVKKGYFNSWF